MLEKNIKRLESLLQNAASLTLLRLQSDSPMTEQRFYAVETLNNRETYPESMVKSPIYQHYVDFQAMSYLKPMNDTKSREHGLKIASVLPEYRKILLRSSVPEKNYSPDFDALERKAIRSGIPVLRLFMGFPDGQMYSYPAMTKFPEKYDVTDRFWFKNGMNNKNGHPVWSHPYLDIWPENGPVLTCYMPLKHEKNQGVIALDLSLKNMELDNHFQKDTPPYLLERTLLDADGKVLISTDPLNRPDFKGDQPEDTLKIKEYSNSNIVKQMLSMKIGLIRVQEDRVNTAYIFHQMQSLDWIYMEKIDLDK